MLDFIYETVNYVNLPVTLMLLAMLAYWLMVMIGAAGMDMDIDLDMDPGVDMDLDADATGSSIGRRQQHHWQRRIPANRI